MTTRRPVGPGGQAQHPAERSTLVDFLARERTAIVRLFAERMRSIVASHPGLSDSQIIDHLPAVLDELAAALREADDPPVTQLLKTSPLAKAHGQQRVQLGFDIGALVREYGVLRDCIYERMEAAHLTPTLRELRVLSDSLSANIVESVTQYAKARDRASATERADLLKLFEQAPGFVCFMRGPKMVFERVNSAYYQLVGHREILGKPVREALPEVAGQGFIDLLDEVFRTGRPYVGRAVKLAVQRVAGAPIDEVYVDFVYQPILAPDGSTLGILVQGSDVTELKVQQRQREVAETALRASEERLRALFESIDEGFCLIEVLFDAHCTAYDYRFLETNHAFDEQTGLLHAQGKTMRQLVPGHDEHWFQVYGEVARTGQSARFENHAKAMNRWFDVYANRVGDPQLRQVVLVFKDITERKRIEEQRELLLKAEASARKQAEEASTLKDEFLATVSHELRTPLNAILGWVHILRVGSDPLKQRRAIDVIERNARAQAQLVDDLLDVSRILAGKLRLRLERVELSALVDGAVDAVRPAADAKAIPLRVSVASTTALMGDPQRLQQVFWNLLSNAVKFTPPGGSVDVSVREEAELAIVTVRDTGQGIDPPFLPHVFERFRQADGSSTRAQSGLGLGLSIVRQLVEMHGGTVSAHSAGARQGALFIVSLPVGSGALAPSSESTPARTANRQSLPCPPELVGIDVLVVDDQSDARDWLRALLLECGARVRTAASAREAHALFREQPPQLLISDVGMPEQDGYALIRELRKLPFEAGGAVPAIALTAYARTDDRTRALLAGFNNHVPKPVEPHELLAVITALLSHRNAS